jgi:transposase
MRELILNRSQRYRLRQQLKQAQDASLYRRTLAILELAQGKPIARLAESLRVTRQTIYNWVDAYTEAFDPLALVDAARSGRPATWTPELLELLETLLHESPTDWDYQAV